MLDVTPFKVRQAASRQQQAPRVGPAASGRFQLSSASPHACRIQRAFLHPNHASTSLDTKRCACPRSAHCLPALQPEPLTTCACRPARGESAPACDCPVAGVLIAGGGGRRGGQWWVRVAELPTGCRPGRRRRRSSASLARRLARPPGSPSTPPAHSLPMSSLGRLAVAALTLATLTSAQPKSPFDALADLKEALQRA